MCKNPAEGEIAPILYWLLPTLQDVKHCPFIVSKTQVFSTCINSAFVATEIALIRDSCI